MNTHRRRPGRGPSVIGHRRIVITEELARRVRTYIARVGSRVRAAERLGVSCMTLDAARASDGALTRDAVDRLVAALDREEPVLAREAS